MRLSLKLAAAIALVCALPLCMAPTGFAPGVPRPIQCTTACSGAALQVGQSAIVVKALNTQRTTNTTLTADPDLQFINLPVGVYEIETNFSWTAGAGGMQWSSTGAGVATSAGPSGVAVCFTTPSAVATQAFPVVCANASGTGVLQTVWQFSSTGSYQVTWAQNSSSAVATTMNSGSAAIITRLQ